MIFRQLFDSESWTYTYLLADPSTHEAIFIDTVFEKHLRDLAQTSLGSWGRGTLSLPCFATTPTATTASFSIPPSSGKKVSRCPIGSMNEFAFKMLRSMPFRAPRKALTRTRNENCARFARDPRARAVLRVDARNGYQSTATY